MILNKAVNPRLLIGIFFTLLALIAFNLSRTGVERDVLTSFNTWYQQAATRLLPDAELNESDRYLKILVTLKDPTLGKTPSIWQVPVRSLLDPTDRENTARVLQLIRESGVFGLKPLSNSDTTTALVEIKVSDDKSTFETIVALDSIRDNIQLMNLLKLLQVYSDSPANSELTPSRL